MATPLFNNAEENGLSKLEVENGAMGGNLASTGNTVRVEVGALDTRVLQSSPPGVDWTVRRSLGVLPRRVTWRAQLKCANEANLNEVELRIEKYVTDGRAYVLTDGKGRTADKAVLTSARRIGPRLTTSTGAKLQQWELLFDVLAPRTDTGKL